MNAKLPTKAQTQLDAINARLLECILAGAQAQTTVRSNFMNRGGSVGGQLLESSPTIAHPYNDLHNLYLKMFETAKSDGVELREIETRFRRTGSSAWSFESRWVTVPEFDAFVAAIAPLIEEIRVELRRLAASVSPEWSYISFHTKPEESDRIMVMLPERNRKDVELTEALAEAVHRVASAAQGMGRVFTGASWTVEAEMDDAPGEIDSAIGAL